MEAPAVSFATVFGVSRNAPSLDGALRDIQKTAAKEITKGGAMK